MNDLNPAFVEMAREDLSDEDIRTLPQKLLHRYWAGRAGEELPGLTSVTRAAALKDCRDWLAMVAALKPGDKVRVEWPGYWAHGKVVEVAEGSRVYGIPIMHESIPGPVVTMIQTLRAP